MRDAIGRDWQCGTLQVDLTLPERMGAVFIDEDGQKKNPVMLHRALFGSLERFTGILIEHYAGRLPLWLAPLQIMIATITSDSDDYAKEVLQKLHIHGLSVDMDLRNEKINYKIREHSTSKIPIILVVGKKEVEQETISLRRLGSDKIETIDLKKALSLLQEEASSPN